ncbi:hypothetical protein JSE7799_00312 [Jannaschia seosinensis]|uniref:Uncharacterized protein n=1 Tax=Jannaschia seosinensis TaxID=313367 RepID=A0A0M7B487_9RHOB|nr:DUF6732 family protein [Jannaschia seosinensis]CUH15584.1 hypothetical protein JSE7799_00312 [Jannaschia seosinensis]
MRFLPLLLLGAPANAHVGHLGQVAGHDHWTVGVGLGVIAGAAVAGWLKGRKKDADSEASAPDHEAEEQPA